MNFQMKINYMREKMEWTKCEENLPKFLDDEKTYSVCVFVTDGQLIQLANYVYNPNVFGCSDESEDYPCIGKPHWHFDEDCFPFMDEDRCFGRIKNEDITHWINLPIPPEKSNKIKDKIKWTKCKDKMPEEGKLYLVNVDHLRNLMYPYLHIFQCLPAFDQGKLNWKETNRLPNTEYFSFRRIEPEDKYVEITQE